MPVVVAAVRTPVAREAGSLKDVPIEVFGALVIQEAMRRCGVVGSEVDDVLMGNLDGPGRNVARLCLLKAGLPVEVPGATIDRRCGSGLQAILFAAALIRTGEARIVVAGGVESMTQAPYRLAKPTRAYQRTPPPFIWGQVAPPEFGDASMGITAENVASLYGISREDQDAFALRSHSLAWRAIQAGLFKEQVVPVPLPGARGEEARLFDTDETVRPDTSLEKLASLPPAFKEGGSVTAGNSCPIADGAAAVVVMSAEEAERRGLEILGIIRAGAVVGVDPTLMGLGPIPAVRKLLRRTGLSLEEIDLIELNEAFASQSLAVIRELKMDLERVNVNGGAIALGHPVGATGAILVTKLVHEMKRRGSRRGLVTMCIGGGQGIAALIEK